MGEAIVLSWETHSAHLLEGLWHQFLSNYNTDFEIVLKSDDGSTTSVRAHHLVLSVFCPNLDSTQKTMNIDEKLNICKEDIHCLMEFMYSGTIKVTGDRLKQLKDGANAIGLTIMVEMIDNINSNKLLEVCPEVIESTVEVEPPKRNKRQTTTGVVQKRPRRQTSSNETNTSDASTGQTSDQNKQKKSGKRPPRKLLAKEPIVDKQVVDKNTEETSAEHGELQQSSNVDENVIQPVKQRPATKSASQNKNNEEKQPQKVRRKRQKKMLLEFDEDAEQPMQVIDEQSKEENGSDRINDQCLEEEPEETYDMSSAEGRSYWMEQMIVKITKKKMKHWTCDLCGQSRDGWYRQLSHIRCHMNPDQLLKCSHCEFVSEMTFDLNRHLAAKHSVGNPLIKMKCPHCEFVCDKKAQLEAHQKADHLNQFVCDECTDAFSTRHKLMSHKLVKHGRRRRANPRRVLPKPTLATLLILT